MEMDQFKSNFFVEQFDSFKKKTMQPLVVIQYEEEDNDIILIL